MTGDDKLFLAFSKKFIDALSRDWDRYYVYTPPSRWRRFCRTIERVRERAGEIIAGRRFEDD